VFVISQNAPGASASGGGFLVTERNPGHLRHGSPDGEMSAPEEGVPVMAGFGATGPHAR